MNSPPGAPTDKVRPTSWHRASAQTGEAAGPANTNVPALAKTCRRLGAATAPAVPDGTSGEQAGRTMMGRSPRSVFLARINGVSFKPLGGRREAGAMATFPSAMLSGVVIHGSV
jgi:hypothetical protein